MKPNLISSISDARKRRQKDKAGFISKVSNFVAGSSGSSFRISVIILVGLVFFAFVLSGGVAVSAQEEKVVAVVNGDKITAQEFARRANVYGILQQVSSIPEYYQFFLSTETGRNSLAKYQQFILERMIEEKLQLQKAKEKGFQATDEEVDDTIQRIIEARDDVDNLDQFESTLKEQDSSLEELKEQLRKEIIRSKLKQEVVGTIEITMGEIKEFYKNNPDYFRNKEGKVKPFDEIKSNIAEIVKENKANKAWSDWMQEVKKNADIERKLSQVEE